MSDIADDTVRGHAEGERAAHAEVEAPTGHHVRTVPRCFPNRPAAGVDQSLRTREVPSPTRMLDGLSDRGANGIAGVLPAMVCGEESAVLVFENERRRAPVDLFAGSCAMLARIAAEEEGHEVLLRSIAERLPAPDHDAAVRKMARRFFASLHTDDIGTHFSRIAWLDSGVCIVLSVIGRLAAPCAAAPALGAALRSIVRDEARHVAFSRRYAAHLRAPVSDDRESFMLVRGGLVALLEPCAGALEQLEVNVDQLFQRLKRRGSLRDSA